jgi:putative endopeptidase
MRRVVLCLACACSSKHAAPATPSTSTSTSTSTTSSPTPSPTPSPSPTPTPSPPPPKAPSTKVTLAEVGLEASSLDRTVDPCVDFFQFACGGWLGSNPIPNDRARWGRAAEVDERTKTAIRALLEEDAKGIGVDADGKKLGDFYASCMDDAAIEKAGAAAARPLLDKTTKIKDAKSWLAAVAELHRVGIDVAWSESASADFKDSTTNVTYLDTPELGLPDRDYYVKPELREKLDAYTKHVARTLVLAGTPQAKSAAAAADVVAIETELAKLTKTATERRDSNGLYNPTDAKALAKQVKSVDWKAHWKALDIAPSAKIIETTPKFFAALDGLRARYKPAQWANYFTYHAAHKLAFGIAKAFDDEAFALDAEIKGVKERPERWKRCIDATTGALGELLGKQYVAKRFAGDSKHAAIRLVDALVDAMADELKSLDWMSDATKQVALAKLAKIVRRVGYPDAWRAYAFDIKRDDYLGNAVRASAFEVHRVLGKSGKPVDRGEWSMAAYEINAYYSASHNDASLPAGILQPPFFAADRQAAANFGSIGMVIGHEITHGFDDQGAGYDGDGNLRDWWAPADRTKFEAKGKCVADMYGTFEAMPGGFVNGQLTLGENIADLGGVKLAFKAYRAQRKGAAKAFVADGFDEDQQFFISVGQMWCGRDRPAEIQRRLTVDRHAPPKFRVYGALRNLPEFAAAFGCAAGTPMRPTNACAVW